MPAFLGGVSDSTIEMGGERGRARRMSPAVLRTICGERPTWRPCLFAPSHWAETGPDSHQRSPFIPAVAHTARRQRARTASTETRARVNIWTESGWRGTSSPRPFLRLVVTIARSASHRCCCCFSQLPPCSTSVLHTHQHRRLTRGRASVHSRLSRHLADQGHCTRERRSSVDTV